MFRFKSSAGSSPKVGFSQALASGLAPDGGLYLPQELPRLDLAQLPSTEELPALAERIIAPFLVGDPLAEHLGEITRAVYRFRVPVTELGDHQVLELFHGPTAAFKDFGAGFLAQCLARVGGAHRLLVATSGDTGGAVAAACHGIAELEVVILYPKGGVSACQERQLTSWGGNVKAFALRGSFDDCQRLVKRALADNPWPKVPLSTANSINIARLLPQLVHHALGALVATERFGEAPDFLIPSGNLGNACAALWAKRMGFPIGRIVLTCNANRVVPEFIKSGELRPRASVATLANAMDIGDPSNLVRLRAAYPDHAALQRELLATWSTDDEIRVAMQRCHGETGRMLDPHTAAAYAALGRLDSRPKLLVSTAHPAKFSEVVEPILGVPVEQPESLASLDARTTQVVELEADLGALVGAC